jgi:hypothetical protein
MASATASKLLTLDECADRLGVQVWRIQRLIDRRLFTKFWFVGRTRAIEQDDLPALAAAQAGDAGLTAQREQQLTEQTIRLAELLSQVVMTSKSLRPPKRTG